MEKTTLPLQGCPEEVKKLYGEKELALKDGEQGKAKQIRRKLRALGYRKWYPVVKKEKKEPVTAKK